MSTNKIFPTCRFSISFKISTKTFSLSRLSLHSPKEKLYMKTEMNKIYSLCLVIVMRTTADDKDGGSSSASYVDSLIENDTNETVGVNKCVNISSNSYDATSHDDNKFYLSDQSVIDDAPIYECIASELTMANPLATCNDEPIYDVPKGLRIDDDVLNKFLFNDDDDLTSSKYSDVTSRCEVLQPSTSSTSNERANDDVAVPRYASTRDNNRKHQKAVRKNFSLWIGVTSCVWGLLLLLMKNYAD